MRDAQLPSGKFTDIVPLGGGFGGILWGSAGFTVPWEVHRQYGDLGLLMEHYPAMQAYMEFLEQSTDFENGMIRDAQLGDWLGPQYSQLGIAFLATAYHVYDLCIMKEVAAKLGKADDARRYAREYLRRKAFFNRTFVNEEGKTMAWFSGQGGPAESSEGITAAGYTNGKAVFRLEPGVYHFVSVP